MVKNNRRLIFACFTSVIFLASYFIFISSANVFQAYSIEHYFASSVFPTASIIGMRISLFVTLLCTFKYFQDLNRQHFLMLLLLSLLITVLLMPLSFTSYPAMAGFSNAIFDLTEPWRQFFAPPGLRATIEGVTEGLTGVIDISTVALEQSWSHHLSRYHYIAPIFLLLLLFFWILGRKLVHAKFATPQQDIIPKSILQLLKQYPFIFIACLFGGINTSIFNYTLFLIKSNAPHVAVQNYQYSIYLGSIIGPIILGRIADKKGIFNTLIYSSIMLIIIRSFIMGFLELHITSFHGCYVLTFFVGCLTATIWTLIVSLVGERLRNQGIFRSFAISNIVFQIGFIVASNLFRYYNSPFHITKFLLLFIDIALVSIMWHFYKKDKQLPPPIH